jgi:hypothetical protein
MSILMLTQTMHNHCVLLIQSLPFVRATQNKRITFV